MRKTLRITLVLLLVGAAATVCTAWTCSIRSELRDFDPHFTARLRAERWEDEARSPELRREGRWIESAWSGPGLLVLMERYDDPPMRVRSNRAGWPYAALEARAVSPRDNPDLDLPSYRWGARLESQMVLRTAYLPGQSAWDNKKKVPRVIPFLPLWTGFAVDTLLFAAAAGVAWLAAWSARCRLRRWRGRCPACGYDLRREFSGGCSECGWRKAVIAGSG